MKYLAKITLGFSVLLYATISYAGNLDDAMSHSVAGIKTQSARMKVIAENIANADSTGSTPGALPYRRKTISFSNKLDKEKGIEVVTVDDIGRDKRTPFKAKFDPSHPAANSEGYVLLPNVRRSIETLDMKEAQRSYEANLGAIETTKRMYLGTVDLLK